MQFVTSADTRNWSAFAPISIAGYRAADGDIYFFAAQLNPLDRSSLVALAPFVHRGCGCIGLLASRDGARWSRVFPLLRAEVDLSGADTMPSLSSPADRLQSAGGAPAFAHTHMPGSEMENVENVELGRGVVLVTGEPVDRRAARESQTTACWKIVLLIMFLGGLFYAFALAVDLMWILCFVTQGELPSEWICDHLKESLVWKSK